jgi:hypothetical protein
VDVAAAGHWCGEGGGPLKLHYVALRHPRDITHLSTAHLNLARVLLLRSVKNFRALLGPSDGARGRQTIEHNVLTVGALLVGLMPKQGALLFVHVPALYAISGSIAVPPTGCTSRRHRPRTTPSSRRPRGMVGRRPCTAPIPGALLEGGLVFATLGRDELSTVASQ